MSGVCVPDWVGRIAVHSIIRLNGIELQCEAKVSSGRN